MPSAPNNMRHVLTFELLHRLRRLSTYVYAALLFALSSLLVAAVGGAFKGVAISLGGGEKVVVNSPITVANVIGLVSFLGLPVVAAIMGRAVQQDFEYEAYPFFFTSPISKLDYLGGRFLAALLLLILIFSAIPAGAFFSSLGPWLDASRVGPSRAVAYLGPCLTILLPNLLLTGAVFFIMAALLRKILPVFLTAVIVLVGYLLGLSLTGELENKTIAALVDPLGTLALNRLTEYWTIAERNARLIPLQGIFLANRALWLSIAVVVFALAYRRFAFAHALEKGKRGGRAEAETAEGSGERIQVLAADKSFSRPLLCCRLSCGYRLLL